jgi:hypothetical protein
MRALIGVILLCGALEAAAAERTYAVLSLIGDQLTVARFQIATGSRLDTNVKTLIETPGGELDRAMAFAVDDALRQADAAAKVVPLIANDAAIYAAQSGDAERGSAAQPLLPALRTLLAGTQATHLVLITKHRGDARIQLHNTRIGSGQLEGVGFYIDDGRRLVKRESGESSQGMLAPFVYARFSLVDIASMRTLQEEIATEAYGMSNQKAVSAWENLDPQQKSRLLQRMIRKAASETVPKLLAP